MGIVVHSSGNGSKSSMTTRGDSHSTKIKTSSTKHGRTNTGMNSVLGTDRHIVV